MAHEWLRGGAVRHRLLPGLTTRAYAIAQTARHISDLSRVTEAFTQVKSYMWEFLECSSNQGELELYS